jgi:riboflavin kinase/FMN adenylyltransferase
MKCALSIGNFDGVHVGHAALLRRARSLVGDSGRVVAMTFDPHPVSVLRPDAAPQRLTTVQERSDLLKAAGADEVVTLVPTPELLSLEPEEFLRGVVERYKPTHIVEGHDFRFGTKARGTPATLAVLCEAWGVESAIVDPVEVDLVDQSLVRASSSVIRWLLEGARVIDAARVLGRPYSLCGEVRRGDQRGRTIGFPTANLHASTMLPADGVYAATAILPDGARHLAAVNIGARPTFAGIERRVEAHIIGESLTFEYAWQLRLEFAAFLRDQVRFDSIARLTSQLKRDCDRVADFLPAASAVS